MPAIEKMDLNNRLKETITFQSHMLHYGMYTSGYQRSFHMDIPWHWHDEFELGFVTGGCVVYQTNYHTFTLRQGDGIFINSGTLHYLHPVEPTPNARLQTQFFDKEFLAGASGSLLDMKYIAPVQDQPWLDAIPFYHDDAYARSVLAQIQRGAALCQQKGPFFELRLRSLFSELWEAVYNFAVKDSENGRSVSRSAENERMKKMMRYIQEHFREKMTVTSIAASVPVSERECYRLFQTHLGITPMEYILSLRVQNAQSLLMNTQKSILEIAIETGFGTSSYFGKIFRQYHHLTPTQYRRLSRQATEHGEKAR
ncbi:MAG: helix-turn-helix domain-containing protein [Oscillospiraceae bacterium]